MLALVCAAHALTDEEEIALQAAQDLVDKLSAKQREARDGTHPAMSTKEGHLSFLVRVRLAPPSLSLPFSHDCNAAHIFNIAGQPKLLDPSYAPSPAAPHKHPAPRSVHHLLHHAFLPGSPITTSRSRIQRDGAGNLLKKLDGITLLSDTSGPEPRVMFHGKEKE